MKILYIAQNNHLDYQDDCLFIGLKELFGSDVVDINKKYHSYKNYSKSVDNFHGKGLTVTKILEDLDVDRTDILNKIKNNFFDYIVYGSIWRCMDYLEQILQYYPKNKILIIDGEDHSNIHNIYYLNLPYFKRELNIEQQNLYPISFAIPTCKVNFNKNKIKDKSFITPKDRSTYIYNDEISYYKDYNDARFAYTMKKAGWDCLRHYEIMGNGCIPYFEDIENCPALTMHSFPKEICVQAKKDLNIMSSENVYEKYINYLEDHFLKNNTTIANSEKFINVVKNL